MSLILVVSKFVVHASAYSLPYSSDGPPLKRSSRNPTSARFPSFFLRTTGKTGASELVMHVIDKRVPIGRQIK